ARQTASSTVQATTRTPRPSLLVPSLLVRGSACVPAQGERTWALRQRRHPATPVPVPRRDGDRRASMTARDGIPQYAARLFPRIASASRQTEGADVPPAPAAAGRARTFVIFRRTGRARCPCPRQLSGV